MRLKPTDSTFLASSQLTMRLKPTDSTFLASSQLTMRLKPTDSTFLASSQLTNYKHSGYPCYCTVRVFVVFHFCCGLWSF
jgi:hypothetical protein